MGPEENPNFILLAARHWSRLHGADRVVGGGDGREVPHFTVSVEGAAGVRHKVRKLLLAQPGVALLLVRTFIIPHSF